MMIIDKGGGHSRRNRYYMYCNPTTNNLINILQIPNSPILNRPSPSTFEEQSQNLIIRHRTTSAVPHNSTQSTPDGTSTQPVLNPDIPIPYHFEFKIRVFGFVVQIAFLVYH